jgi:NADH:ubiquinone oxidoreductase subunit 5 (subunit L)/multisubunit Na+/H+ antiporter MnhA subunit
MGLMAVGIGVGLVGPASWLTMGVAVTFLAAHHGLAKAALFLGVGVAETVHGRARRMWLLAIGLVLPALALAGAPLTSGSVAKSALKDPVAFAPERWKSALDLLLPLTAIGTTLLMTRFLHLIARRLREGHAPHGSLRGLGIPWLAIVSISATMAVFVPRHFDISLIASTQTAPGYLWSGTWPILIGLLFYGIAVRLGTAGFGATLRGAPPGDLLAAVEWTIQQVRGPFDSRIVPAISSRAIRARAAWDSWDPRLIPWRLLIRADAELIKLSTAGVLLLAMMVLLYLLAEGGSP